MASRPSAQDVVPKEREKGIAFVSLHHVGEDIPVGGARQEGIEEVTVSEIKDGPELSLALALIGSIIGCRAVAVFHRKGENPAFPVLEDASPFIDPTFLTFNQ
ncbi:hypothetical protein DSECCO2_598670 [anaerobic digester metagenome]